MAGTLNNIGRIECKYILLSIFVFSPLVLGASGAGNTRGWEHPVIWTQLPLGTVAEAQGALAEGMLRSSYGDTARIVLRQKNEPLQVLTEGFHSACDPSVSFDGRRILFAGNLAERARFDECYWQVSGWRGPVFL